MKNYNTVWLIYLAKLTLYIVWNWLPCIGKMAKFLIAFINQEFTSGFLRLRDE